MRPKSRCSEKILRNILAATSAIFGMTDSFAKKSKPGPCAQNPQGFIEQDEPLFFPAFLEFVGGPLQGHLFNGSQLVIPLPGHLVQDPV